MPSDARELAVALTPTKRWDSELDSTPLQARRSHKNVGFRLRCDGIATRRALRAEPEGRAPIRGVFGSDRVIDAREAIPTDSSTSAPSPAKTVLSRRRCPDGVRPA